MFIKVKCCNCGRIIFISSYEENRRKATRAKRNIKDKVCCEVMGGECEKNKIERKIK
jgi:hypothetical protein